MNKTDFIKNFQEAAGIPNGKAREYYAALCAAMAKELAAGGDVPLQGIGRLVVKERAARQGRNPRTGEVVTIPACKVVTLRTSKELKEALKR